MKLSPDYLYAQPYLITINLKNNWKSVDTWVMALHLIFSCLYSLFSICRAELLSPKLNGSGVLCFLGAYFLPVNHPIFLQRFQPTDYKAGNQMSKLLKTVSKINITVLWLRSFWSFLCEKSMSFNYI